MNRRVNISLGLVLSALVCLTSIGGTFASWNVANNTVNKLTVGEVQGEIVEEYTDGLSYMPGATVEKLVNIKNTGTVDSVIRVKLTPAWGDSRDSDGKLIINDALSTDSVHINCSSDLWYYDAADGYYYYLGVLTPGELTREPVMTGFTLASSLGNDFAGKQGDILVELECIQAGGNGISLWGKTLSELSIEYSPETESPDTVNVCFNNPDKGFTFDAANGDLFVNFKDLVPGESRSETLRTENSYNELTEITVRAEFFDDDLTPEDKLRAEELLRELAVITITDSNGVTVYSGAVWDGTASVNSMKSRVSLGIHSAGDKKDFTVSLYLKPETDNAYSSLLSEVKWIFEASNASSAATPPTGTDSTNGTTGQSTVPGQPGSVPKLGDSFVTAGFASMAIISGAVFLTLLFNRGKSDKPENNPEK